MGSVLENEGMDRQHDDAGTLLVRPRLHSRLDRCLTDPVAVLSAPAGYGKTVLLDAWLDQAHPLPIVRLGQTAAVEWFADRAASSQSLAWPTPSTPVCCGCWRAAFSTPAARRGRPGIGWRPP